jgi:hypothetical protein
MPRCDPPGGCQGKVRTGGFLTIAIVLRSVGTVRVLLGVRVLSVFTAVAIIAVAKSKLSPVERSSPQQRPKQQQHDRAARLLCGGTRAEIAHTRNLPARQTSAPLIEFPAKRNDSHSSRSSARSWFQRLRLGYKTRLGVRGRSDRREARLGGDEERSLAG